MHTCLSNIELLHFAYVGSIYIHVAAVGGHCVCVCGEGYM